MTQPPSAAALTGATCSAAPAVATGSSALAGADRLYGFEGDDYLAGGPGADIVVGGPGARRARRWAGQRPHQRPGRRTGRHLLQRSGPTTSSRTLSTSAPATALERLRQRSRIARSILDDMAWACRGQVDIDLVKVTMPTHGRRRDSARPELLGPHRPGRGRHLDGRRDQGAEPRNGGPRPRDRVRVRQVPRRLRRATTRTASRPWAAPD